MLRNAVLIFILLLFTIHPYSQFSGGKPDYQSLYRDAENLYHASSSTEKTDSIAVLKYLEAGRILIQSKIYNETGVDCFLKSGILSMSNPDPGIALRYFQQAVFVAAQNPRLSDSLIFQPLLFAGSMYYSLNALDSAVYYYKKAESVYSRYPALPESERLFNKFGALYYETGDYDKSISYFEKALSLVEENKPVNLFFVINYKNNIATALMKLGRYDQALEIFTDLLKYPNPGDALLYNTGNTYFEQGNYNQALHYLRKVRNLDFEKYSSLVKIFIALHQYDSAQYYLSKANALYALDKQAVPVITSAIMLKYSGDLKLVEGKVLDALRDYQSAIIILDAGFTDKAVSANPVSFTGLQNFQFLFDALLAKASALIQFDSLQPGRYYLDYALDAYASALSLVSHIEKTYFSDDARLFLKTKVNPSTRNAVDIAIRLFEKTKDSKYISQAFGFVENNKATVLQAGLKNLELSAIPGLPANLVAEEKSYRAMLARLKIQSEQVKNVGEATILQKKMRDIELSLAIVQNQLDENPVYHELKFYSAFPNMDSLQKRMRNSDEAILSYYYTNSRFICFYITKEGSGFSTVPLNEKLFSEIHSLRRELQSPQASGGKYLREMGSALFKEIIAPIYEKIRDKRRLVIIPYNELGYLPFEMMVNPVDGNLLLKKFAISYNYSVNFISNKYYGKETAYEVLAMAPFSEKGNSEGGLPALPFSLEEIKDLPGKKISGADATKAEFMQLASQFSVIHLATHAVANDTNLLGSYIEFYRLKNNADTMHRLYEQEIYATDLKSARLVILSACETGNGRLVNGEGVISLSRAFSYAGCKSVVTSLWKADEVSTSFITKRLHHYLQKGLAIDESLQKAKLDYLNSGDVPERFKNPAYWAHLVLLGDFQPVTKPDSGWYIWAGIFVFIFLGLYIYRKKSQA